MRHTDRAHHFDPPDPEDKHAAFLATTEERTKSPARMLDGKKDQSLTKAIRERPRVLTSYYL
jgi:hypothetical protein